ncbi:class I SAM-dependent methyltransferase [Patescibacteria group bacterium]|nr:class I SAM-dependent methyltransferase [Patescibacteria group bacterium]
MNFYSFFSGIYKKSAQKMSAECFDFIKKGDKILDFGCGSAIVTQTFKDCFKADILGVDVEDQRIFPIPFKIIGDMEKEKLPFNDLSFDVVLISYVLHHTKNPKAVLKEIQRVAKRIIIYEDLPKGLFSKIRCWFHEVGYITFFQKTNYQFSFKTEKEWKQLFDELGLKIIAEKRATNIFEIIDPGYKIIFVLERI